MKALVCVDMPHSHSYPIHRYTRLTCWSGFLWLCLHTLESDIRDPVYLFYFSYRIGFLWCGNLYLFSKLNRRGPYIDFSFLLLSSDSNLLLCPEAMLKSTFAINSLFGIFLSFFFFTPLPLALSFTLIHGHGLRAILICVRKLLFCIIFFSWTQTHWTLGTDVGLYGYSLHVFTFNTRMFLNWIYSKILKRLTTLLWTFQDVVHAYAIVQMEIRFS